MLPLITFVMIADELGKAIIQHFVAPVRDRRIDSGVRSCKSGNEPSRPMITEAAGAGQYILPGTDLSVPRIQIVTIEQAMELRDRAVRVPLVQASHKRAAREEDGGRQGAMDL